LKRAIETALKHLDETDESEEKIGSKRRKQQGKRRSDDVRATNGRGETVPKESQRDFTILLRGVVEALEAVVAHQVKEYSYRINNFI
jgi:hypothetical protein